MYSKKSKNEIGLLSKAHYGLALQEHHFRDPIAFFHSNAMAGDHPATEPMSKAEAAKWHGGGHGGKIPCDKYLAVHPSSKQLTRAK